MERLTERYGIAPDGESDVWVKQHDYISAARKLCDYEDLEERGLLVRLPCKVGDTVYVPTRNFISELRITMASINSRGKLYFSWVLDDDRGIYLNLDGFSGYELGKTVFLTHEEAVKKLEEMKKNGK